MNKSFKVTCGLLVYGLGSGIFFANDEWYLMLLGFIIFMSAMFYILNTVNKGEK
jgi:hypothetical protein